MDFEPPSGGEVVGEREPSAALPSDAAVGTAFEVEPREVVEKLREQTEVVAAIYRVGQILSAELDPQKLVQAITDAATELTGAQFGSFFYNVDDGMGGSYMLYTLSGVHAEAFAGFPMPRATDLFGPTFRGDGIIRIADVRRDPRYGHSAPHHGMPSGHLPVTSYLAVPVFARHGEVLGGLFFGHAEPDVFTARHERIVEGVAAQAAIAMDNARLFQAAQQAIEERDELISREQAARRQAEVASRAKDEFLSLLSHEIRNPLNAILGWVRLLSSGKLDAKGAAQAIETIERNANLQARLIEDMLDVSRIVAGKLRLDTVPLELTAVINAAIDTVRPTSGAKEIRLQAVLDFGAGLVLGDPVRLQQVIWNLLANALKFTPRGGHVQVRLERSGSHVEISVQDTGPGIDPEFLPHVFERFRQGDASSSKMYGGLGLGLAIVRHLVEQHGGTVGAGNRADGTGAVFTVTLPVLAVRTTAAAAGDDAPQAFPTAPLGRPFAAGPRLEAVRVLVVDDEADARVLLARVLEEYGAEVRTCGSAAEALSTLARWPPQILISDIGMPMEDGYALIRTLRALPSESGGRIPAVALTAYARVEDRLRALSEGYNMHIAKPVEPAELALVLSILTQGAQDASPSQETP